jgi:hypothetical protein
MGNIKLKVLAGDDASYTRGDGIMYTLGMEVKNSLIP